MLVLGIESTSHTSSIGFAEDGKITKIKSHTYRPDKGGINPREAADHHREYFPVLLEEILDESGYGIKDVDRIAYSIGPGLGPSLKVGASMARFLSLKYRKPLVPVNHGIAHLEVARVYTDFKNPLYLYVSGGNTQLIITGNKRYVVIGETLDIGIGNFLDKLARDMGIPFPGAPRLEQLAREGSEILDCPYIVRAMDVSFSGLYTYLRNMIGKKREEIIAYNAQEYSFSALAEVAERAMAHYGLEELTITGGVAMNRRLRGILRKMTEFRGWKFAVPPDEFLSDNGGMIALAGERMGIGDVELPVRQYDRVDAWSLDFLHDNFKFSPEGVGGESIIYPSKLFSMDVLEKRRIRKDYRDSDLDTKIRTSRMRKEVRSYSYYHELNIKSPNVIFYDGENGSIYLEKMEGVKLINAIKNEFSIDFENLGEIIGRLHSSKISHGDLTLSNIIYNGDFILIDPSMGELNADIEDLAIDIHLFKESLKSAVPQWEPIFKKFMKGYERTMDSEPILRRVVEIERRRRYVT